MTKGAIIALKKKFILGGKGLQNQHFNAIFSKTKRGGKIANTCIFKKKIKRNLTLYQILKIKRRGKGVLGVGGTAPLIYALDLPLATRCIY